MAEPEEIYFGCDGGRDECEHWKYIAEDDAGCDNLYLAKFIIAPSLP